MAKISVNELATKLIDRKGLSKKHAVSFVNDMFDIIQKGLEQDKAVKVKGFGTFKIINVDDRESINVNTGERVLIEGHSKITFIPDAVMKELVNKPFSQFETVVLKDGVDFDDMPSTDESLIAENTEVLEDSPVSEDNLAIEETDAASAPLVDFFAESEVVNKEPIVLQEEPLNSQEVPLIEEQKPLIETPVEEPVEENADPAPEQEVKEPEDSEASEESVTPDDSSEEDIIYEEETSDTWKKWILPAVFCLIGFAAGYLVANMMNSQPAVPEQPKQEEVAQPKLQPQQAIADSLKQQKEAVAKDTVKPEPELMPEPKEEAKPEVKPEVKTEPKPEVKPESKPELKPEPKKEIKSEPVVSMDKYEKMDSRILHGAYRIVGTDHVEKIKATDNLARICKRTIGPGMECYLEVYNGIKGDADLKPGKDIKIPKLELKKKNKTNNK